MLRVHIGHAFERMDLLERGVAGAVVLTTGQTVPDGTQVLVDGRPTEERLDTPGLQGVIIPWSGVWPAVQERLAARPHLRVHNLHHNASLVAEHAVGMALACVRRLRTMHDRLAASDWRLRYDPDPSPSLHGHSALVLGHGAIGKRIATVLDALGMDVTVFSRSQPETACLDQLDALLPEARVIVLALPHTPRTHHLFDADRLARCHPLSVLVNIGRAELCEEQALYDALAAGRLFGAGLDVWWRYPEGEEARLGTSASELPFHELDNVLLSPHRAGHAQETEALRMRHLARSLRAWAAGEEVPNPVDVGRGY